MNPWQKERLRRKPVDNSVPNRQGGTSQFFNSFGSAASANGNDTRNNFGTNAENNTNTITVGSDLRGFGHIS